MKRVRVSSDAIREAAKAAGVTGGCKAMTALGKKLGVSYSTVHRALRGVDSHVQSPGRKAAKAAASPALAMSLQLSDALGVVEIKLRNGGGRMLGTLVLEQVGVRYRRPNQKAAADRVLQWEMFDRLMQLGLLNERR